MENEFGTMEVRLLAGNPGRARFCFFAFAYAAIAPVALLEIHESFEQTRAVKIRP